MKIKKVCEITGLTERTIRFYVEQKLLQPSSEEVNERVYYDYSIQDIEIINQIATMRKIGFSIKEISDMINIPDNIDISIQRLLEELQEEDSLISGKLKALKKLQDRHFSNISEVCEVIQDTASKLKLPASDNYPNFGRFDEETREEKESAYIDFLVHHRIKEKIEKFFKPFIIGLKYLCLALLVFLLMYGLSYIPKSVNQTYSGLKYRISSSEEPITVNIQIKGKLHQRFFQTPIFKGSIQLSGLEDSKQFKADIYFHDGIDKPAYLFYSGVKMNNGNVIPYINTYAKVNTDKNFSYLILNVFEPEGADQKSLEDLVIVAPTQSIEEADKLLLKAK